MFYKTLFMLFLLTVPAFLYSGGEPISLVCISSFPPYAWQEEGELKGIDVDIVNELFRRAKLEKTIIAAPPRRAIAYLENGSVDGGFSGIKSDDREKIAHYASFPIHVSVYKIFVKKGKEFRFKTLEDLYGKTIGKNKAFHINDEFDVADITGKIKVDDGAFTMEQNLEKLINDRFDALVGNVYEIRYTMKKMGVEDELTELPEIVGEPVNVYLVLSKASPLKNKQSILIKLSNTLREMEMEGFIAEMHAKYVD